MADSFKVQYLEDAGLLRSLIDKSQDGMMLIDSRGIVLFANAAAIAVFADRYDHLVGARFEISNSSDDMEIIGPVREDTRYFEMRASEVRWRGQTYNLAVLRDITGRKLVEQKLRISEQNYRHLFEHAALGIFQVSLRGEIKEANHSFARMFGYKSPQEMKELVKKVDSDLFADPSRRLQNIRQFQQNPAIGVFENDYKRRDGSVFTGRAHLQSVRDAQGNILHIEGFVEDISERRKSDEALRKSEERFSKVFSSSPVGISITTLSEGRFVDANQAFLNVYGYARDEVVGHTSSELKMWVNPEVRDEIASEIREKGVAQEKEVTLRMKSGDLFTGIFSSEIIEISGEDCMIGLLRDITDQKLAYEARSRLAVIVESASDAILAKTLDGVITAWNHGAEILYGYSTAEILGRNIRSLYPPEDVEEEDAIIKRLMNGETVRQFESVRIRKNGAPVDVSLTISPIRDVEGRIVGVSQIARDISERKKVEQQIRSLNEELEKRVRERTAQLEAANKELEAFSYSVSHDLRAPLRHIHGYSDLLTRSMEGKSDEKELRYLKYISDSVREMGELIDDLLAFSRMGRIEMRKTSVDLRMIVEGVIGSFGEEISGRDIQWDISDLPTVEADAAMLRLVFQNLLGNAVKYTRPRPKAIISIGSEFRSNEVIFSVKDNGVGFDMKYANNLFGVFQRLHRADEFEGTGIGLANVRRIIHRHGGNTWAEGATDHGATFYFSLPYQKKGQDGTLEEHTSR